MKTKNTIALCLLVVATACASFQEESVTTERTKVESDDVFYATLEQSGAADATKVYADANLQVLWNADDRISIYNCYTYGYEYAFQGATGKTAGAFAKVADDAEFVTGNPLDKIYAVYPYSQENDISNTGELNIRWPSTQTYKPDSFGIGSNVMVSVTTNNQLRFRNVGGYLALKLYGDNVSVTSITLRGNNGEKLSGKATITCATDEDPTLSFDASGQGSLRLNCAQPVTIGTTAEDATVFWLVVPPTQFTQGFNITVRTNDGRIFVKSTDTSYDIERNTLCRMAAVKVVPSDIIPFEDANFKAYCVEHFDTDNNGEISRSEAETVLEINIITNNIESLRGIEYFPFLQYLSCDGGWDSNLEEPTGKLAYLDLSQNSKLEYLSCIYNKLICLDISGCTNLNYLNCNTNQLTSLNLIHNSALKFLSCYGNKLVDLDLSECPELNHLTCYSNQLTTLDLTHNPALTYLFCAFNQINDLNVSLNSKLETLSCFNNQLTSLDVSHNTTLSILECSHNNLTSLDVSHNTALTLLGCAINQLTSLNISSNTDITALYCYHNCLTNLIVSNNTELRWLECYRNQLTELDVSHNSALRHLMCFSNQLTSLNLGNNSELRSLSCNNNQLNSLDVSNCPSLASLQCNTNQLNNLDLTQNFALYNFDGRWNNTSLLIYIRTGKVFDSFQLDDTASIVETGVPLPSDYVSFQDNHFKAYCVENFDKNGDGEISLAEAMIVRSIACDNMSIESLSGIECFTNLESLSCDNNYLTSIDVSHNTWLSALSCNYNQLTSLDVSQNIKLFALYCYANQLTSLDVSHNIELCNFGCGYNQLGSLDVSSNIALEALWCYHNQFESLDVSHNIRLEKLGVEGNPNLTQIWLRIDHPIKSFSYDRNITQVYYKD